MFKPKPEPRLNVQNDVGRINTGNGMFVRNIVPDDIVLPNKNSYKFKRRII